MSWHVDRYHGQITRISDDSQTFATGKKVKTTTDIRADETLIKSGTIFRLYLIKDPGEDTDPPCLVVKYNERKLLRLAPSQVKRVSSII